MAASIGFMATFSRDFTQENIQSDRDLERDGFISAPPELNFPEETVLIYRMLDLSTTKLAMIEDYSFANAKGLKTQLGFIILMIDNNGISNSIHYGSSHFKRVTRSMMASEVHALILCFDNAFAIMKRLEEILKRKVLFGAYIYSKIVFDVIAKDG